MMEDVPKSYSHFSVLMIRMGDCGFIIDLHCHPCIDMKKSFA